MKPLLSLEAVSKCYWRGLRPVEVLDGVSLDVEPGEFAAVWGPRGTGKTTLLEIAAGLRDPDAGQVRFAGQDLAALDRKRRGALLHREIGVATRLGPASRELPIGDWIAMVSVDRMGSREAGRRADGALRRVGAGDLIGEAWPDLPDGARALVSIARAIVREPRLLLVDDPSAGLGLVERGGVATLLSSLAEQGVAVLMTATDVTEVRGAGTIWSLAGGTLIGRSARPVGTVIDFPG